MMTSIKHPLLGFVIFALLIAKQGLGQVKIGDNPGTIETTSLLELESTTKVFLPPRMTTVQRVAISSPSAGSLVYDTDLNCLSLYNGSAWGCMDVTLSYATTATEPGLSCLDILNRGASTGDGVYWIDPDGGGGNAAFQCQCDMTTDGGGWTLVLNYLHQGGTNPAVNARTTDLPLLSSTTLGNDESGTAYWGHAAPALLNTFTYTDLRFYGAAGDHGRVLNFKTSHAGTISYFNTGTGSCSGIESSFTALAGHTANLPASSNSFMSNQGTAAMTEYPFYQISTYHWGIGSSVARWELDNYPNDSSQNSYHQIWVR